MAWQKAGQQLEAKGYAVGKRKKAAIENKPDNWPMS